MSIRTLFPNLAVIRGRDLFMNYALGISSNSDLESVSRRYTYFFIFICILVFFKECSFKVSSIAVHTLFLYSIRGVMKCSPNPF